VDSKNIWILASRAAAKASWVFSDGTEFRPTYLGDDFLLGDVQAAVDGFIDGESVYVAVDRHRSHQANRRDVALLARETLPDGELLVCQSDWKRVVSFGSIGVFKMGVVGDDGA
jgi:hypothetical protein